MATLTCAACARLARYLDGNKECPLCAESNPLERAAIALWGLFSFVPWADLPEGTRQRYRGEAVKALRAAIDVEELAEHIGPIHAAIVHTHYLGGTQ